MLKSFIRPQGCVVIFQFWEKLESHLIEHGVGAEGEVLQVDPSVAGQDTVCLLIEPDMDLVHKHLNFAWNQAKKMLLSMPCHS